jgi:hypothetical protein
MRLGHLDRPSVLDTPIAGWMYYYELLVKVARIGRIVPLIEAPAEILIRRL